MSQRDPGEARSSLRGTSDKAQDDRAAGPVKEVLIPSAHKPAGEAPLSLWEVKFPKVIGSDLLSL